MKAAMSQYLISQKPLLKKMVEKLSKYFGYVSILGTDTVGKRYEVQRGSIGLNDSMWVERGFVVRVYNGKNYSEFSLNDISDENLDRKIDEICTGVQEAVSKLATSNIHTSIYPIIDEDEIKESFSGEVQILPEKVNPEEKIRKMTAIRDKALGYSKFLVNFIVNYEEVHISKMFISVRKELEQSYIWSQGMTIPVVRRDNSTKYSFLSFSGLKGVEVLDEMAEAFGRIRAEVTHEVEAPLAEDSSDQRGVRDAAAHEFGLRRDVVAKPSAQIVEHRDPVPHRQQFVADVRSDETRAAGDQDVFHDWLQHFLAGLTNSPAGAIAVHAARAVPEVQDTTQSRRDPGKNIA
jgi:TldD protein